MRLRPRPRAAAALVVALPMLVPTGIVMTAPVSAASPCRVVNTTTGASTGKLATALKNAAKGATLKISGTCVGNFVVKTSLMLQGTTATATLKGGGGRTLTIAAGKKVGIERLVITGGKALTCPEWDEYVCGGGIYNAGALTLDGVTVVDNKATGAPTGTRTQAFGGGIYNAPSGTLTLTRSTVRQNRAEATEASSGAYAGGIANNGVLAIRSSTITGNQTDGQTGSDGAGIYNEATTTDRGRDAVGELTAVTSTISGNVAFGDGSAGGGLASGSGTRLVIRDSTITENVAVANGGGIAVFYASATIVRTIIAANTALAKQDCALTTASTGGRDVLLGIDDGCDLTDGVNGNQVGTAASPLDPVLGPLAANGGPTRTHALLVGSPAIDAAGPGPCASAKDQRGVSRPKGGGCDIGAFEAK